LASIAGFAIGITVALRAEASWRVARDVIVGGFAMPRSIQGFVWLSLLYIAWFSYWNFADLLWPSAHHLELLAKAAPADRPLYEYAERMAALTKFVYFLFPFILFALLAGLARRGWARWGVVLVLVVTQAGWLLYVGYTYFLTPENYQYLHHPIQYWLQDYRLDVAHWGTWFSLALKLTLIALLFSPNAKPWFRRRAF
jgi:hypothetical protein